MVLKEGILKFGIGWRVEELKVVLFNDLDVEVWKECFEIITSIIQ